MTPYEQAMSIYNQAFAQGFASEIALDMAKFAVDKIINYGQLDNSYETFWIEVMDELESM